MNSILSTNNLDKRFGETIALNEVSVQFQKGKIYAFIGQNGAGKTTFMRVVLGLSFPDSGSFKLFEESSSIDLLQSRKRIGSIIEHPALYSFMTAWENLNMIRKELGIPNTDIIDNCLELVDLSNDKHKKVRGFSLGMKQRLGIAGALLNNPEFLVLDEPTNGLDPIGAAQLRNLLLKLSKEKNTTILISSHILSDLYQIATDFIFIDKGTVVEQITKKELDRLSQKHIELEVDKIELTCSILESSLKTNKYTVLNENKILLYDCLEDVDQVIRALSQGDIHIHNIQVKGDSLEDYFINMLGGRYSV